MSAVVLAGGKILSIGGGVIEVSPVVTQANVYKFIPGFYMHTGGYEFGSVLTNTSSANYYQTEINLLAAGNMNVAGYTMCLTWWNMEDTTQATNLNNPAAITTQYPGFANINTVYNYLQSKVPGAALIIYLKYGCTSPGNFTQSVITGTNWGATSGNPITGNVPFFPRYMINCGGTLTMPTSYGATTTISGPVAPIYSGSPYYGFGFSSFGSNAFGNALPAMWNFICQQPWNQLLQALLQYPLTATAGPYAGQTFTIDNHPGISLVALNDEISANLTNASNFSSGITVNPPLTTGGAPAPSAANYFQNYYNMCSMWSQTSKHTPLAINYSFGFDGSTLDGNTTLPGYINNHINGNGLSALPGICMSTADGEINDWGLNGWAFPQAAPTMQGFIGINPSVSSPSGALPTATFPDLSGVMPYVWQVQAGDYCINSGGSPQPPLGASVAATQQGIIAGANRVKANWATLAVSDAAFFGTNAWTGAITGSANGFTTYWNGQGAYFAIQGQSLSTLLPVNLMSAPQGLAITAQSSSSVSLAWTPQTTYTGTGLTYTVFRNGVSYATGIGISSPSYTDTAATPGDSYAVAVANSNGTGPLSASVTIGNFLGMNLNSLSYFNPEQPFTNLMKGANTNATYMPHAWGTFTSVGATTSTGEEAFVQIDSNGYPTSMTAISGFPGGQQFTYLGIWMNFNFPSYPSGLAVYPSGSYTIAGTGGGTFYLSGDPANGTVAVASGSVTVNTSNNSITSTAAAGATWSVTVNISSPTTNGLKIYLGAITAALKVTTVVPTSQSSSFSFVTGLPTTGSNFSANFIASLNNVKRVRCMDWLGTNQQLQKWTFTSSLSAGANSATFINSQTGVGTMNWGGGNVVQQVVLGGVGSIPDVGQLVYVRLSNGSPTVQFVTSNSTYASYTLQGISNAVTFTASYQPMMYVQAYANWGARTQLTSCSWALTQGVPYEACYLLGQQLGAEVWENIPGWANSFTGQTAFWTSHANLALSYSCKQRKEFTNEWWNNVQAITSYLQTIGYATFPAQSNPDQVAAEFYGVQVAQIADANYAVFGATQYAAQVQISMGWATVGGAGNTNYSMAAPDWVALGNKPPYQHPFAKYTATGIGIDSMHYAPYWQSNSVPSTTDQNTILAQSNPLNELSSLSYSQTGTSGQFYSSIDSGGIVGSAITGAAGIVSSAKSGYSATWGNLPIHCYEGGEGYTGGSTAFANLYVSWTRTAACGYAYYDPTNQLSANPGFLPAILSQGNMASFTFFSSCGAYTSGGVYGALESTMQTLSPLSSAPPKWAACQKYMAA